MLKPRLELKIPPTTDIEDACVQLVLAAHEAGARVWTEFNSVELFADPTTTRVAVLLQWEEGSRKRDQALEALPPAPRMVPRFTDESRSEPVTQDELDAANKLGEEDPELDALVCAMRALALLEDEARQRVLRYCHERFGHRVALAGPRGIDRGSSRSTG